MSFTFLIYVVGATAWGYRSWAPVLVTFAAVALLALLGLGTRSPRAPAGE